MQFTQPKSAILAIAAVAILTACATKSAPIAAHIQTKLDVISHEEGSSGNFCMTGTKTDLGGMATTPNVYQHALGKCKHQGWRKEDVVILYFGDDGAQAAKDALDEELDSLMHPENYLTSGEIAELDCTDGSECHANEALLRKGVVVHFASDSATPRNQAEIELVRRVAQVAQGKQVAIVVAGHTDSTATRPHNIRLSVRRAEVVKKLLQANGLDARFVVADGRASSSPVGSNETSSGRAQNRRTEIKAADVKAKESKEVTDGNAH